MTWKDFGTVLKETHLPEELQPKAGAFLVQTVHVLDTEKKNQMYRQGTARDWKRK